MTDLATGRRAFLAMIGCGLIGRSLAQEPAKPGAPLAGESIQPGGLPTLLPGDGKKNLLIRQTVPHDGLSPGDRLLNSQADLQVGDRFLAELRVPGAGEGPHSGMIGGEVEKIQPPGRFGRNGYLQLRLSQLVRRDEEAVLVPWTFETGDLAKYPRLRRAMINALFMGEGAGIGLGLASQFSFSGANPLFLGIGGGVGLLVGIGVASLRRGVAARLEPGDRFDVDIGSCRCRALPRGSEIAIYPALAQGAKK